MVFAAGQTYRLPADQPDAWFARVLEEVARAYAQPVTIAIRTSDSRVVTGHLEGAGRGSPASVEVWKPNGWQGHLVNLPCDEIEAFKLLPGGPLVGNGEARA